MSCYHLQNTSSLGARVKIRSTVKLPRVDGVERLNNFEPDGFQETCAASCLVAAAWVFLMAIIGVLAVALLIWLSTLGFIPRPWYGQGMLAFPNDTYWNDTFALDWVFKHQVGQPQFLF